MKDQNCPSPAELQHLVKAQLPESQADQLFNHVAECPACEETVVGLEKNGETVFDRLPRQPEPLPFQNEPELRQALDDAKTLDSVEADPRGEAAQTGLELMQLRDYRILEKVGEGGMGAVYRAVHTRLKKMVAIKVLSTARVQDRESIVRFEREMAIIGGLQHPHIVQAFDAGEESGRHFLVMEFVEGQDLAAILQQQGPLPITAACEVIRQAALGLQYAHENGLVHRDIKPSNLVLARPGERGGTAGGPPTVKILDLGLARWNVEGADKSSELTSDGQIMGTLDYMAPEQGGDSRSVDIRADIYSLGATLFKLLTGDVVFGGPEHRTMMQKLQALALQPAPSIQTRISKIPAPLAAIVDKMLAKRPEDRYQTPAQVAAALEPFCRGADLGALIGRPATILEVDDASAPADAPTATIPRHEPARRVRHLVQWVLLGAALLGAVMVIGTKKGIVEIDAPEGGLPADVRVAVSRGGEVVEILQADNQWAAKVVGGEFQVALQGGDDRFELLKSELKVNRFGKNIVSVRLKPAAPSVAATTTPQITLPAVHKSGDPVSPPPFKQEAVDRPRPYVVVAPDGTPKGEFRYLTDALDVVGQDSIIEVHGNGPFRLPAVEIRDAVLKIRNGKGYRPRFIPPSDFGEGQPEPRWLTLENVTFSAEGCDFTGVTRTMTMFAGSGPDWSFRDCRLTLPPCRNGMVIVFRGGHLNLADSLMVSNSNNNAILLEGDSKLTAKNCRMFGAPFLQVRSPAAVAVTLENNLLVNSWHFQVWDREANAGRIRFESTNNTFAGMTGAALFLTHPELELKQMVEWRGRGDRIYRPSPTPLTTAVKGDKTSVLANAAEWNAYWGTPEALTEYSEMRLPWDHFVAADWKTGLEFFEGELDETRSRHAALAQVGPDVAMLGPGAGYDRAQRQVLGAEAWPETPSEGLEEGPVVLLRGGKAVRGFLSLTPAIEAAQDEDIIEIRSSSLFDPVQLISPTNRRLTLRAGPGHLPRIPWMRLEGAGHWSVEGLRFVNPPDREPLYGFVRRLAYCSFENTNQAVTLSRRMEEKDRSIEIVGCYLPMPLRYRAAEVLMRNSIARSIETLDTNAVVMQCGHCFFWSHDLNMSCAAFGPISGKGSQMAVNDSLFDVDALVISKHPHNWQGHRNVYRVHGMAWAAIEGDGQVDYPGDLAAWQKLLASDGDSVTEESAVRREIRWPPAVEK